MRAALAAAIVGLSLSGCFAGTDSAEPTTTSPSPRPLYALDCTIDNWEQPCTARASPNDSPAKAEIDIAVNPTDPNNVFVASKDLDTLASDCVWAIGQFTKDGGHTWQTTYVGGTSERPPTSLFYGWQCITDPIVVFDRDGVLHYSLQVYDYAYPIPDPSGQRPGGDMMVHGISRDGGETFSEFVVMHVGDAGTVAYHDFMRIGTNPTTGTVFTIWDQLSVAFSLPVMVAVTDAGGRAVARPPVYFPNTDPDLLSLGIGAVFGGKDGTVYAWLSGFNSGGRAVIATSTDDGVTFSVPKQVFSWQEMGNLEAHACSDCPVYEDPDWCPADPGMYEPCYRHGTLVELAADTSDAGQGCLYAAWGGREAGTDGPSDIYARSSCDQGDTWSEPVRVNAAHTADGQWMPRVSVDGHGTPHVVYYTRAYDPEHNFIDAEHAYSLDGGVTWVTERLTATSFDGNKGVHQDGFPFIGDYIGIASAGDHTWMGYPDCHGERCEIGVAHSYYDHDAAGHTGMG